MSVPPEQYPPQGDQAAPPQPAARPAPVSIEENQAALRAALLSTTESVMTSTEQAPDAAKTYAEGALMLAQALAVVDPSLHPQTTAQGPGSRPNAAKAKPQ